MSSRIWSVTFAATWLLAVLVLGACKSRKSSDAKTDNTPPEQVEALLGQSFVIESFVPGEGMAELALELRMRQDSLQRLEVEIEDHNSEAWQTLQDQIQEVDMAQQHLGEYFHLLAEFGTTLSFERQGDTVVAYLRSDMQDETLRLRFPELLLADSPLFAIAEVADEQLVLNALGAGATQPVGTLQLRKR